MRTEKMKSWLAGTEREEKATRDGVEGHQEAYDTCHLSVWLTQHIWDTGEILCQMLLVICYPEDPTISHQAGFVFRAPKVH